jgi:hypothetical protein
MAYVSSFIGKVDDIGRYREKGAPPGGQGAEWASVWRSMGLWKLPGRNPDLNLNHGPLLQVPGVRHTGRQCVGGQSRAG